MCGSGESEAQRVGEFALRMGHMLWIAVIPAFAGMTASLG